MPSGKIHDSITLLLAPMAGLGCYFLKHEGPASVALTAAFIFGGLMFGPDLDTNSKQYARWWVLRPVWLPYQIFFSHRSRWTHGLLFGSLIRVVYFMGLLTIGTFASMLALSIFGGKMAPAAVFADGWRQTGSLVRSTFGLSCVAAVFVGLWLGAASHTFTDLAGTYIKTGRIGKTL